MCVCVEWYIQSRGWDHKIQLLSVLIVLTDYANLK